MNKIQKLLNELCPKRVVPFDFAQGTVYGSLSEVETTIRKGNISSVVERSDAQSLSKCRNDRSERKQ